MSLKINLKNQGFSIVELLVTLVVVSIVVGAVYLVSKGQEKNMLVEDRVAELQSSLQSGVMLLAKELRMAGYDPTCSRAPCSGFVSANATSLSFIQKDPITNNQKLISYSLYDSGGDGDNDLGRLVGSGTLQPVILNVDAFDLVYFSSTGTRLSTPVSNSDLAKIKVVEITIVAHSETPDPNYKATPQFTNLQGETVFIAPADGYRRKSVRLRVYCRNN